MKGRLVGIVSRKKDDGKTSTTLWLDQVGFNDYESEADVSKGYKTAEVYTSRQIDAEPGDIIQVNYEPGFKGLAQISDISVVSRKK